MPRPSTEKPPVHRPPIGKSTVHRLLLQAASGGRVSEDAASAAQKAVGEYLEKAGRAAAEHLKVAKRNTVNKDLARQVLVNKCIGVSESDLSYTKGERRGVSVAGVLRVFSHEGKSGKKASGLGFNISEEAKGMIAGAAEAFIDRLGKRARQVMVESATKVDDVRATIKARDVRIALMGSGL